MPSMTGIRMSVRSSSKSTAVARQDVKCFRAVCWRSRCHGRRGVRGAGDKRTKAIFIFGNQDARPWPVSSIQSRDQGRGGCGRRTATRCVSGGR